jgi:hypothetical protein
MPIETWVFCQAKISTLANFLFPFLAQKFGIFEINKFWLAFVGQFLLNFYSNCTANNKN